MGKKEGKMEQTCFECSYENTAIKTEVLQSRGAFPPPPHWRFCYVFAAVALEEEVGCHSSHPVAPKI